MTGHQPNPGMGKTLMQEDTKELDIEGIARACGVQNVKVLDPINLSEFENTIKELQHRIVEGEDPTEVINDICTRIKKPTSEVQRLLKKLNSF
jgi:TPP-dependent indolepyruvate ferredoxin oxidoreductase alpha subunit